LKKQRNQELSTNQIYSMLTKNFENCEESVQDYGRIVKDQLTRISDPIIRSDISELVSDSLEAACIRNTSLIFAFKEIDKFYVLNSQESSTVEIIMSTPNLNCRQVSPIQKLTRNKLVQLMSAMRSTEEIVGRMLQLLKGDKNKADTLTDQSQDAVVDEMSAKLTTTFVEKLKNSRLLLCANDVAETRPGTTLGPRELFSTFSDSILTTPTSQTVTFQNDKSSGAQTFIIVRTDDEKKSANSTEMKTTISVGSDKSAEAQTSIFVGQESDNETNDSNSGISINESSNISTTTTSTTRPTTFTSTTTTSTSRPTTFNDSNTSKSFRFGSQNVSTTQFSSADVTPTLTTTTQFPPIVGMTMTPRSTRPTGTTTTTVSTTTSSSITSRRINPSLLNLLGRGG
jgi:hypothetical protein